MRILKTITFSALLILTLGACTGGTVETTPEELEETATDVAAAIAAAQEDLADLGQAIENSEAEEDLRAAWEDLQGDLTPVFTSLQTDQPVDQERVMQILDEFQADLEAAGAEIEPELRDTWESLRDHIERLMS